MEFENIHSPRWADPEQRSINLMVQLPSLGEVPFTANPNDPAKHGRTLFTRAFAGEFGPIADYPVKPLKKVKAEKVEELSTACREEILAGFECSALGEVHLYPSKETDQLNLASSVLDSLLPGLPEDWLTPFWCADAESVWAFRMHTASQIQQVGRDAKASILASMGKNAHLAERVEKAMTVEEIAEISWIG